MVSKGEIPATDNPKTANTTRDMEMQLEGDVDAENSHLCTGA